MTNALTLTLNGASIRLKAYAPAHTDSDISVTFAQADIVHVGDTFWNGVYPFIDYSRRGGIDGMIAASEANLSATTKDTIIIPGHGKSVSNRSELEDFRDMLVAIRENVAKLKRRGLSRDEIVAARPTQAFDARYGQFVIDPAFYTTGLPGRLINRRSSVRRRRNVKPTSPRSSAETSLAAEAQFCTVSASARSSSANQTDESGGLSRLPFSLLFRNGAPEEIRTPDP